MYGCCDVDLDVEIVASLRQNQFLPPSTPYPSANLFKTSYRLTFPSIHLSNRLLANLFRRSHISNYELFPCTLPISKSHPSPSLVRILVELSTNYSHLDDQKRAYICILQRTCPLVHAHPIPWTSSIFFTNSCTCHCPSRELFSGAIKESYTINSPTSQNTDRPLTLSAECLAVLGPNIKG